MIGFCGYARVGKNTAAEELVELKTFDYKFEYLAFAEKLKSDLDACVQWANKAGIDTTTSEFKEHMRPMYVLWSRIAKDIAKDEMIWVKRLQHDIDLCNKFELIPLITDVRYDYEIEHIYNQGGVVIFIERPGIGPKNDEEDRSFKKIRETYADLIKTNTIINDGTRKQLGQNVAILLQKLKYF